MVECGQEASDGPRVGGWFFKSNLRVGEEGGGIEVVIEQLGGSYLD